MTKKMLIDAAHPEETRVVIVDTNRVEELDFESRNKRQLRGNVYLARVTRVEPSLQAAFVEYGGNRHGFLAFSEIHPDYYQIPYEDRLALIEAQEAESKAEAAQDDIEENANSDHPDHSGDDDPDHSGDNDEKPAKRKKAKPAKAKAAKNSARSKVKADDDDALDDKISEDDSSENEGISEDAASDDTAADDKPQKNRRRRKTDKIEADDTHRDENVDPDEEDAADEADAEIADEQAKVASRRRKHMSRRRYKIQEVIKRGQILLIQAVKEERGNKGAAMTTYLSLAGRYCVLMPNTPRGGGISRKISNGADRKRLKAVMNELEVPQGMGVIVRTAGAKRTKAEIKRDYDYLARLWEEIRQTTLKSIAPALIHEEGNLVKRSIRDLYNKDIDEVLVQGDTAYKNAKAFIKMLMPSHAKHIKSYKEDIPLFLRYDVERQIEDSLSSIVQLKSGGYLVIHPTEALVSVDVNSGRSTGERNVERTALRTNLEAAEELSRQMRLRDLAGLIVVDFIDMEENRNNRAVEKKMKEAISRDRARIQAGRISQFGLMEISRQRRRRSLLEGSTAHCQHCAGVGRKRTVESSALAALRAIEEIGIRQKARRIRLKTSPDVALYLFNEKRHLLQQVDEKSEVFTEVIGDESLIRPSFEIEITQPRDDKATDPLIEIERAFKRERDNEKQASKRNARKKPADAKSDDDAEANLETDQNDAQQNNGSNAADTEIEGDAKRRRRGMRGGRNRKKPKAQKDSHSDNNDAAASADNVVDLDARRGKNDVEATNENTDTGDTDKAADNKNRSALGSRRRKAPARQSKTDESSKSQDDKAQDDLDRDAQTLSGDADSDKKDSTIKAQSVKARTSTRRKAPDRKASTADVDSDAAGAQPSTEENQPSKEKKKAKAKPRKAKTTAAKKPKSAAAKADQQVEDSPVSAAKTAPARRKAPSKVITAKDAARKTDSDKALETKTNTVSGKKASEKKASSRKTAAQKPTAQKTSTKKTPTRKAAPKKQSSAPSDSVVAASKPSKTKPAKAAKIMSAEQTPSAQTPSATMSSRVDNIGAQSVQTSKNESANSQNTEGQNSEKKGSTKKKKSLWDRILKP